MVNRIGIVVMFRLNEGGGAPRVVVDLIKTLSSFGYKVHLLSPWRLDYRRITEIYEPIQIEKEYNIQNIRLKFCIERNFTRKLIKKEFIKMAKNVDFIIDIDGGVLHNYLPEEKQKKYIIWRISGIDLGVDKSEWEKKNLKLKMKFLIKKMLSSKDKTLSTDHKIYAVDYWTKNLLKIIWNLKAEDMCLYPEIKTSHFNFNPRIKKDHIIILGRISPNKRIDESIKVFAKGAKNSNYKLIIIGGITPDSENYIEYLKNIAEENGILNKIKFIGNPSFIELKKVVEESKILIECQRDISLTMTSIECLAAGVIVLVHKNGGTFKEVLDNGKYGIGFESIEEGGEKLRKIIKALENNELNAGKFVKRAEFFSGERFKERLKQILDDNGI